MKGQLMKNKSASQSVLVCLFTVAAFAVYSSPAEADTTTWTGASSTDWFNDANWTNHVPSSSTDAFINNGGKPQINSSGATARSLTLGLNAAQSRTLTGNGTNGGVLDVVPHAYAQDHPDESAIY